MKPTLIASSLVAALAIATSSSAIAGAADLSSCCTPADKDFPKVAGNLGNQGYSSLTQIDKDNIIKLGPVWLNHVSAAPVTTPTPGPGTNDTGQQLRVLVRFVTDRRLQFVRGPTEKLTLPPGRRTLTVQVRAQTTGRIPVKVQVLSRGAVPDTIAERTMVIRSTAYNLVALFVTIGAAMFLLGWWGRRFLPRRRS